MSCSVQPLPPPTPLPLRPPPPPSAPLACPPSFVEVGVCAADCCECTAATTTNYTTLSARRRQQCVTPYTTAVAAAAAKSASGISPRDDKPRCHARLRARLPRTHCGRHRSLQNTIATAPAAIVTLRTAAIAAAVTAVAVAAARSAAWLMASALALTCSVDLCVCAAKGCTVHCRRSCYCSLPILLHATPAAAKSPSSLTAPLCDDYRGLPLPVPAVTVRTVTAVTAAAVTTTQPAPVHTWPSAACHATHAVASAAAAAALRVVEIAAADQEGANVAQGAATTPMRDASGANLQGQGCEGVCNAAARESEAVICEMMQRDSEAARSGRCAGHCMYSACWRAHRRSDQPD